jgi:hypothetical protein
MVSATPVLSVPDVCPSPFADASGVSPPGSAACSMSS